MHTNNNNAENVKIKTNKIDKNRQKTITYKIDKREQDIKILIQ